MQTIGKGRQQKEGQAQGRADRGQVVKAHSEPSAVRSVGPPEAEFEVLGYDALRAELGKLVHVTRKAEKSTDGRRVRTKSASQPLKSEM